MPLLVTQQNTCSASHKPDNHNACIRKAMTFYTLRQNLRGCNGGNLVRSKLHNPASGQVLKKKKTGVLEYFRNWKFIKIPFKKCPSECINNLLIKNYR